jgi:hypothetical protein
MSDDAVRSACASLAAEPLFHLSLHSKELFHSNLIAWFCEAHPDAARAVFGRWVPERVDATTLRVQRERGHLDLAVELPGLAPFVVENKVFAPPIDAQLDDYAAGDLAGLAEPTLLLLSLGRPLWDSDTYVSSAGLLWRYVSYSELAEGMDSVVSTLDGFDAELISHYGSFAKDLNRLATVAGDATDDDPIAVSAESAAVLRGIRMHDAIGKLRARVAIAAARSHTMAVLGECAIRWEAGFTNGVPLVAAFLDRGDGDWLGWQYQGGQWRIVVIATNHDGRTEQARQRRHAYVAEKYMSWFDFEAVPGLTGRTISEVPPTEARREFNGYNPDFVYRYRKLPDLTRAELVVLSHHYLSVAATWGR